MNSMINRLLEKAGSKYRLVSLEQMNERSRDAQELGRVVAHQAYERKIDELNKHHLEQMMERHERITELKRRLACAISSAHYYRKKSSKKPVELET